MRSRSRSDANPLYPNTYWWDRPSTGSHSLDTVYWPHFTWYDSITDVGFRRRKPGVIIAQGYCRNVKIRSSLSPSEIFLGDYDGVVTPVDFRPNATPSQILSLVPPVPDSDLQQLRADTLTEFSERFPEEISIGNFLLEAREIGQLLPKIQSSLSKTLAGGYLGAEFGWKPLLGDIQILSNITNRVVSRLEWLRDTYGKWTRLGLYRANVYEPTIGSHTLLVQNNGDFFSWEYRLKSYRADYRGGGWLFHRLEHLNDDIGFFRAFIGAFGLNNPLKVIWNALPFSFVVDWFGRVSSHLSRLATIQPAEEWVVSGTSNSVVTTAVIDVWQRNRNVLANPQNADKFRGSYTVKVYERWPGLPFDLGVFNPNELDLRKQSLLLAMLRGV